MPEETTVLAVTLFVDGACSGNPGKAAVGVLMTEAGGRVLREFGTMLDGEQTNNEAEYRAVLRGLREARNANATHVTLHSDSKLVVEQVAGRNACNVPTLLALRDRVRRCREAFAKCEFVWIPREKNEKADALASEALGRVVDKTAFNHFNFQLALKERDFWHEEAGRYKRLYEELSDRLDYEISAGDAAHREAEISRALPQGVAA